MISKISWSFAIAIGASALTGFMALAASTSAPPPPDAASELFGHSCPVYVSFGSYAMGIDHESFSKTRAILKADKGVTKVEQKNWGREGERSLCVHTKGKKAAKRVYEKIRMLFSSKLQHKGPVGVTLL